MYCGKEQEIFSWKFDGLQNHQVFFHGNCFGCIEVDNQITTPQNRTGSIFFHGGLYSYRFSIEEHCSLKTIKQDVMIKSSG